ncbi:MAG: hypothetical protein LUI39_07755 [Lachnospiraceae bacterium]|nr:hypothetical protein [Lachnospiraceae bacterium]
MLHEKKFYLAVLLSVAAIIAGTVWPESKKDSPLACGTFLELLNSSLQSQIVLFILPLAAVLPCGEEYLREKDSRFLRFLIIRRSKVVYCLDKVVTTALSGAIIWLLGAFFAGLFFFLLFFRPRSTLELADEYDFYFACHAGTHPAIGFVTRQPFRSRRCARWKRISGVRRPIPFVVRLHHPAGTLFRNALLH